jgi:hypothetical protein
MTVKGCANGRRLFTAGLFGRHVPQGIQEGANVGRERRRHRRRGDRLPQQARQPEIGPPIAKNARPDADARQMHDAMVDTAGRTTPLITTRITRNEMFVSLEVSQLEDRLRLAMCDRSIFHTSQAV